MQIQNNFTFKEFVSTKDKTKPNEEQVINIFKLSEKLQELRDVVGPINVTSGFRSVQRNKDVGGSINSIHLQGLAADIKFDFSKWNDDSLVMLLTGLGWTNIGIYKRGSGYAWIHLDIAQNRWNETNGWNHIKDSSVKFYNV